MERSEKTGEKTGTGGTIRRVIGRVTFVGTVALGFLSVIFSRDFGSVRLPAHHSDSSDSDKGIAYADASACSSGGGGGGDSSACDCDGGGGGGGG